MAKTIWRDVQAFPSYLSRRYLCTERHNCSCLSQCQWHGSAQWREVQAYPSDFCLWDSYLCKERHNCTCQSHQWHSSAHGRDLKAYPKSFCLSYFWTYRHNSFRCHWQCQWHWKAHQRAFSWNLCAEVNGGSSCSRCQWHGHWCCCCCVVQHIIITRKINGTEYNSFGFFTERGLDIKIVLIELCFMWAVIGYVCLPNYLLCKH